MQMKIIVDTQDDYEAWLKEQKLFKNSLVQN
jgi:cytochrome c oxidase subunit 2